jgi:hypothetical protein
MAPEVSAISHCEWGQFVILDKTIPNPYTYRNRLGYSYNPILDAIDEDGSDGEIMKSYYEHKDHKEYKDHEEDCFGKDGSMKTFIIKYAGIIAATCITIIMLPMWYFQY